MDDEKQLRRNLSEKLRGDSDGIAASATQALVERWLSSSAPVMLLAPAAETAGREGTLTAPATLQQAANGMDFGFRRLNGVVAASVLVDEPGLIADDMRWLARMFAIQNMVPAVSRWHDAILQTYVEACVPLLSPAEAEIVRASVEAAVSMLDQAAV